MFEPLNAVAGDISQLKTLAADPQAGARIEAIRVALVQTAERFGDRQATTELERTQVAALYRGLLAASRIVVRIREHHQASAS